MQLGILGLGLLAYRCGACSCTFLSLIFFRNRLCPNQRLHLSAMTAAQITANGRDSVVSVRHGTPLQKFASVRQVPEKLFSGGGVADMRELEPKLEFSKILISSMCRGLVAVSLNSIGCLVVGWYPARRFLLADIPGPGKVPYCYRHSVTSLQGGLRCM